MDYTKLAEEFLHRVHMFRKFKPQQQISESMHGEFFVLQHIALRESHVIPSEISDAMNISSARIAVTLNSLESKGHITRQIDTSDRRRILIKLTPEGKKRAENDRRMLLDTIVKMLMLLGEHDAKEYIRITGRMAELAQNCEQ